MKTTGETSALQAQLRLEALVLGTPLFPAQFAIESGKILFFVAG
jgi:hypothetical protein